MKVLNTELNEESSKVLEECAKNNITSTSTESVSLKILEETQKNLKLEMNLAEIEAQLAVVDKNIAKELQDIEGLKSVLAGYEAVEADVKTAKNIEKLGHVSMELQTSEDVDLKEIINKVKKLQK